MKKGDTNVKDLLEDKLEHILGFTLEHACDGDSDFAIIAKNEKDRKTLQIRSKRDFTKHQIFI